QQAGATPTPDSPLGQITGKTRARAVIPKLSHEQRAPASTWQAPQTGPLTHSQFRNDAWSLLSSTRVAAQFDRHVDEPRDHAQCCAPQQEEGRPARDDLARSNGTIECKLKGLDRHDCESDQERNRENEDNKKRHSA